jgi:hypothetical protein
MDLHAFAISPRWASALLLPATIVALAPQLKAQSEADDTYMGENPARYASVRVLDGDATIRKGELEEPLSRGIPIAEGDVVESHGRGVLQLTDGTQVAFGSDTRFQVATLFTEEDQDRQVLLRLDYGRLRITMGPESEARLRIDMPSGSAVLADGSSASFEMERDRTARVKVLSGRMVFSNARDKSSLRAGERLTVYSDQDRLDRIQNFNTYSGDSFDAWCDRSLTLRRGPSWDKVPAEIRYYADDLDANGEWVYVEEYRTWCWRPLRVSAEWRPYWRGRWGAYPGGMTWISDEPWGYVTYHHGRWGWGASLGWYWIPGVFYSPAWVAWHASDANFGWAPLGYYNHPVAWGYGAWGGGTCWNVVEINFIHTPDIHIHILRDPGLIRRFDSGSGAAGWNSGSRPLVHPWRQSPLVVSQSEFRNPAQLQRLLQDPQESQNRLHTYEQQSRRTIYRRPFTEVRTPPSANGPAFEDHSHLRTPGVRPSPSSVPLESPRPLARPLSPPNRIIPGPTRPIPKELPVQPRGTTHPVTILPPVSQPPAGPVKPGRTAPWEQPLQSQDTPPETTDVPPPWPKKKRPLTRP